jgi:biotin carboxyl carrier protein
MRATWLDGERARTSEVVALGGGRFRVVVDEASFEATVEPLGEGMFLLTTEQGAVTAVVTAMQARRFVRLGHQDFVLERTTAARSSRAGGRPGGSLEAPMPGVVTRVMVAAGDPVRKGQPLLAVEAMKMEHLIRSPRDGRVLKVRARQGEMVNGGVPLVEIDAA